MFTNMTVLSRQAFETAMDEMLTVEEAVMYLEKQLQFRSLRNKIERFADGRTEKEVRALLVSGLLQNHPEMKKDSVERRVRGWMNPKSTRSLYKQDAIETAFLLGLNLKDADDFVAMVCGERLHYRNAKEIVYIYALNNGLSYTEAMSLSEKMEGILMKARDTENLQESDFTLLLRSQIEDLHTEEDLRAFLNENIGSIGHLHNQAYQLFMEMLSALQNPVHETDSDSLWQGKKEKLTVRDVLREYLFENNIQSGKKKESASGKGKKKRQTSSEDAAFITAVESEILKGWPDEFTLSKMQARKADVTRKVLILLFLATDEGYDALRDEPGPVPEVLHYTAGRPYIIDKDAGETSPDLENRAFREDSFFNENPDFYDYLPSRDEVFQDMKYRLDYMLTMSGFSPLDPRSGFDWLVLYCMCVEDILDMDDRLRSIFYTMFGNSENESDET